jgi:hypothetical protein
MALIVENEEYKAFSAHQFNGTITELGSRGATYLARFKMNVPFFQGQVFRHPDNVRLDILELTYDEGDMNVGVIEDVEIGKFENLDTLYVTLVMTAKPPKWIKDGMVSVKADVYAKDRKFGKVMNFDFQGEIAGLRLKTQWAEAEADMKLEIPPDHAKTLEPETKLVLGVVDYEGGSLNSDSIGGLAITRFEPPGVMYVTLFMPEPPPNWISGGVVFSAKMDVYKNVDCCMRPMDEGCKWAAVQDELTGTVKTNYTVCDQLFSNFCTADKYNRRCGCYTGSMGKGALTKCFDAGCSTPLSYQPPSMRNQECPSGCMVINRFENVELSDVGQAILQVCNAKELDNEQEESVIDQSIDVNAQACNGDDCVGDGSDIGTKSAGDANNDPDQKGEAEDDYKGDDNEGGDENDGFDLNKIWEEYGMWITVGAGVFLGVVVLLLLLLR